MESSSGFLIFYGGMEKAPLDEMGWHVWRKSSPDENYQLKVTNRNTIEGVKYVQS